MKRFLSLFLVIVMFCCVMPTAFAASDEATAAADELYALGLFNGTGTDANGKPIYDLDRAPTRHEAVTMLVRLLGKGEEALAGTWETPFTDVADWAKPYVGYAYANGLTSGTSATTFGGNSLVTASQYLTFVLRALGYDSSTDFKWDAAWELSDELGFTSGKYNAETTTFMRGDVVIISRNALSAKLKGTDTMLACKLVEDEAVDGMAAAKLGFDVYGWFDNFHLIYDIRTFTLYAFMNYTGYNDNNGHKLDGVRKAVREELAAMDIKISSPTYFADKQMEDHEYDRVLGFMGDAPNFSYISTNGVPSKLRDLPQKLKEFYEAADIPTLYEKYRPQYEKEQTKQYADISYLVKMVAYLDIDDIICDEFGVEINLLMSYGRGMGMNVDEKYYDFGVIREGMMPHGEIRSNSLIHEYSHSFINDMVAKLSKEVDALERYYDVSAVTQSGYNSWEAVVYESFVRALAIYFDPYEVSMQGRAQWEYNQGFILTPYICERIPEFETFDGTWEEFMKLLLVEYPQYA